MIPPSVARPGLPPGRATAVLPPPVVRVAGLPARVLGELRFTETSALVRRILASQRWLAEEGEALAAALHEVIGTAGDGPLKPRLVGLRRALHRVRSPAATEWSAATRAAVPPDLVERVDRWRARLQDWRDDQHRLPQVLTDEAGHKEATLRSIAAELGFRRALRQSSRPLSEVLDRWLADPADRPRRQSLTRLAKYVSRAATKTSPYSAFAVSGNGTWCPTGEAVRLKHDLALRGALELYGHGRELLHDALLRQPELWESIAVRVNPSAVDRGRELRFLGRPPAEPMLGVPATAALRECLDFLHARTSSTLGDLRDHLAAFGGAPPEAVTRFLDHLVEIGLLEAYPPGYTAAGLADWLDRHGGARLAEVAHRLRLLANDLTDRAPVTDVDSHRSRQEAVRGTVAVLSQRLGITPETGDRRWQAPHDAVAHDSVVCAGTVAECGLDPWRQALDDLDAVRRWLAVFEPTLPLKLALGELWRTRCRPGTVMPFLDFHRMVRRAAAGSDAGAAELRRLLSGAAAGPATGSSEFALVRTLHQLREQARRPVRGHPPDGAGPVRVDPAVLAGMASGWPLWVRPIGSMTCYVQTIPAAGGLSLVLNETTVGYGQWRGRLAHLLSLAGEEPGPMAAAPPGRLAELAGPHGSSLNDRLPTVPYEIDYPFSRCRHPSGRQIPLTDLVVEHDPGVELLRLRSVRHGTALTALALGLLVTAALPAAARLLVQAFGEHPAIPFSRMPRRPPPRSEIQRRPRVMAGRVVLYRGAWIAGIADTPVRAPGERDGDYLLRLTRWRQAAGIPSRCFVRALPARDGGLMLNKARKPIYVDFDNWFLVQVLENMLRPPVEVLAFEEALPDPDGRDRAVELLVEIGEG